MLPCIRQGQRAVLQIVGSKKSIALLISNTTGSGSCESIERSASHCRPDWSLSVWRLILSFCIFICFLAKLQIRKTQHSQTGLKLVCLAVCAAAMLCQSQSVQLAGLQRLQSFSPPTKILHHSICVIFCFLIHSQTYTRLPAISDLLQFCQNCCYLSVSIVFVYLLSVPSVCLCLYDGLSLHNKITNLARFLSALRTETKTHLGGWIISSALLTIVS